MKKRKGFTFTEIIIAMVIILTVAVFFAMSIPKSYEVTRDTEDITNASNLAGKYLETIKSNFTTASIFDSAIEGDAPPVEVTSEFNKNGYFTVNTFITDTSTAIIQGVEIITLKEIDITYIRTKDSKELVKVSTVISRPR